MSRPCPSSSSITRSRESEDRRVVHVRYAEGGREAARTSFMPLAAATDRAGQRFSAEVAIVLRFLAVVNEELGDLLAPGR